MNKAYTGGCQCGAVRYDVELDLDQDVIACNCSRCGRMGFLLSFAPASKFTLKSGADNLTQFEFNKHVIKHQFCKTCGVQSFAYGKRPTDGAELAAINVRCLDGIDVDTLKVKKVDGRKF